MAANNDSIQKERSKHAAPSRTFPYELYFPTELSGPAPLVVILHGFGGSTSNHSKFAQRLTGLGSVVIIPQMRLSAILKSSRHRIREANVVGVTELVEWLIERSGDENDSLYGKVDEKRVAMCGHSAGGAVAFEACCVLQEKGINPRGLLLMDGVPWVSTYNRAKDNKLKYAAKMDPPKDPDTCFVASLRAKRASINANGLFYQVLGASSESFTDIEWPKAKHGDFADEAYKSWFMRQIGMASTQEIYESLMKVCVSFLKTALQFSGNTDAQEGGAKIETFKTVLEATPDGIVVTEVDSKSVEAINVKKLPLYLK